MRRHSEGTPKIRFVDGLSIAAEGICLFWLDEIHIDSFWKNTPVLPHIIKHEMRHYRIIKRVLNTKSSLKRIGLILYNNLFEIVDLWVWFYMLYYKIKRNERLKKWIKAFIS